MKKYLIFVPILALVLVLSGCSLTSPASPAAKPTGSIWKSADGGKTWEAKNKTEGKADFAGDVLSIAINPFDANNVFVGTREGGILKTEDGGENWKYLDFLSEKVYGLDIDPVDGKVIYASGVWQKRGKVWKSFDSGVNWTEIYTAPSEGPLVINLVVDKKNSKTIYISTSDNNVLKTMDAGSTWKNIFVAQSPILKIAIDRVNSNLIYGIAQGGGIFRSKNGGQDFEEITQQVSKSIKGSNQEASVLETDPANGNWVYLAGRAGLLRSKDAGDNWEKIATLNDPQNFPIKTLVINSANAKEIIYGAAKTAYKSIDGGATWATFQLENAKTVNALEYSLANPSVLYLGLSK